jgi:hypothetical protein
MQKSISRSALVQLMVVDIADQLRRGDNELDNFVDLGDVEEGSPADTKKQSEIREEFNQILVLHKKTRATHRQGGKHCAEQQKGSPALDG